MTGKNVSLSAPPHPSCTAFSEGKSSNLRLFIFTMAIISVSLGSIFI